MGGTFGIKFNGNGSSFTASAPTSGEYQGVLIYMAPQFDLNGNLVQTQELAVRGNGNTDIIGAIIAPSAYVTMYANSNNRAFNSQIIAYRVDNQGGATVRIAYNPRRNYNANLPILLTLLK